MGQMNKKLYKKPSQKYYVKGDQKVERKILVSDVAAKAIALAFYPFYLAVSSTGKLIKRLKSKFKNDSTQNTFKNTAQVKFDEKASWGAKFKSSLSNGLSTIKSSVTKLSEKAVPFIKKNKWAVSGVTAFAVIASASAYVLLKTDDTPVVAVKVDVPVAAQTATVSNEAATAAKAEAKAAIIEEAAVAAAPTKEAGFPEFKVKSAASARAMAVEVNGTPIAYFKTEEEANALLEQVRNKFKPAETVENRELVDVYFYEDVKITEKYVDIMSFEGFDTVEEALALVSNGSKERRSHEVQKGENFWTIATLYGISVSDLEAANPDIKPELLQIGMDINLVVAKPMISVCTVERATFKEAIPFEIVYENNSSLFKGEQKTKAEGSYGEREVVAELVKQNGKEVARKTISEQVNSKPVTKVVYKGTKNPPPRVGSGVLSRPVYGGPITSPFGPRGRGRHLGIDIGVKSGTPVMAADGGTVTFAGWGDSYGYHVIIDHGSGMTTLYAHNSSLAVSRGQKVHKGQVISYSGNTGNSYGAHLHFEVRINGVHQNPARYVNF